MQTPPRLSLLGLPPEIRNLIWKFALGGREISLARCEYESLALRPRNWQCRFDHEDEEGDHSLVESIRNRQKIDDIITLLQISFEDLRSRRRRCRQLSPIENEMSVQLIRVNQQINKEAEAILYSTNIFFFRHPDHFHQWLSKRNSFQLGRIKAIGGHSFNSHSPPKKVPNNAHLPNLDVIGIKINAWERESLEPPMNAIMHRLGCLRHLSHSTGLKLRKIPISLNLIRPGPQEEARWSTEEVQPLKEEVRLQRDNLLRQMDADEDEWRRKGIIFGGKSVENRTQFDSFWADQYLSDASMLADLRQDSV